MVTAPMPPPNSNTLMDGFVVRFHAHPFVHFSRNPARSRNDLVEEPAHDCSNAHDFHL